MKADRMDKEKLLQAAFESFMKKDFHSALSYFEKMLRIDPSDKRAQLGVILCDLAKEDEEEASALFDFYVILKEEKEREPEERVIQMVQSLDNAQESLNDLLSHENIFLQEGISYKDFKSIVDQRGGFKRAFEDIMYSTKVIITQKSDFFDFIENLIEHGFTDMVYSYLEDASKLYPADEKLQEFVEKLHSEKR